MEDTMNVIHYLSYGKIAVAYQVKQKQMEIYCLDGHHVCLSRYHIYYLKQK